MDKSNINNDRDDFKLIYYTINKLRLSYMKDEIIDIAFIGYTKALNSYKEENSAFSTYAYTCIKNEIGHYLKMKDYNTRKANYDCISLNQKLSDSDYEYIEFIEDDFDLEKSIIDKITVEKLIEIAKEILTDKQYQVFYLCYVNGYKDVEAAKILRVSRERIGQSKRSMIRRLRRNIKIQKLKEEK